MKARQVQELRRYLEAVHADFVESNEIMNDAIAPALKYIRPVDQEFSAFVCAVLAYGKVAQIQVSVRKILDPMGDEPVAWLIDATRDQLRLLTKGWAHRFNTSKDMLLLLYLLKQVYTGWPSLEVFLSPSKEDSAADILERLSDRLMTLDPGGSARFPKKGASFWFLLSRPSSGSACKRLNLFLRWMVGESEMDLNLWRSFPRSRLIVPVDTHLHRQARKLGLTKRAAADWKTAEEITAKLRFLDPSDPTRFDFALCHIGIRANRAFPAAGGQES